MLAFKPAVFAVENHYCIKIMVTKPALLWVRVDGYDYYDECNGVLRSSDAIHEVTVPMTALDSAKEYTVCIRPLVERKPYFTQTKDVKEYSFVFHPLPTSGAKLYHISDAHNRLTPPIAAARTFGPIDGLILNGDLFFHAGDPTVFDNVYTLCSELTGGSLPIIASRGNHDMRGAYAERLAQYMPTANGRSFYTFRLGSVWGIVLDTAEDKPDDHEEYGHTVICHAFRLAQTAFLCSVIANANQEYLAPGVTTRLVICHNPFVKVLKPPFNIEQDVYNEWISLLREHIHPHAMISGHLHRCFVQQSNEDGDLPFPCPLVVGSKPDGDHFAGCGIRIERDALYVSFTDDEGQKSEETVILK